MPKKQAFAPKQKIDLFTVHPAAPLYTESRTWKDWISFNFLKSPLQIPQENYQIFLCMKYKKKIQELLSKTIV